MLVYICVLCILLVTLFANCFYSEQTRLLTYILLYKNNERATCTYFVVHEAITFLYQKRGLVKKKGSYANTKFICNTPTIKRHI